MNSDAKVRLEACRMLVTVGTREVAVPALEAAVEANPKDRPFGVQAKNAIKSLQAKAP